MVEWKADKQPVEYRHSMQYMEQRVADIIAGDKSDLVWLLEHPPLYTAGTSANAVDLLDAEQFPVFDAGRGGQYTYHGPGQRVVYFMLDLKKVFAPEQPDLRKFIFMLEQLIINVLAEFGINGVRKEGRVGIWIDHDNTQEKIAAIGIRVRKWVSFHGIAINLNPNLQHYQNIVPCGIQDYGVTSMEQLGVFSTMQELDSAVKRQFAVVFG